MNKKVIMQIEIIKKIGNNIINQMYLVKVMHKITLNKARLIKHILMVAFKSFLSIFRNSKSL